MMSLKTGKKAYQKNWNKNLINQFLKWVQVPKDRFDFIKLKINKKKT